jgi:hypothetical protein
MSICPPQDQESRLALPDSRGVTLDWPLRDTAHSAFIHSRHVAVKVSERFRPSNSSLSVQLTKRDPEAQNFLYKQHLVYYMFSVQYNLLRKYICQFRKPRIRPKDPSRWPRGTFCPQKLPLTSPTSGGRSAGIVRSRTQPTEFSCLIGAMSIVWAQLSRISTWGRRWNVGASTSHISTGLHSLLHGWLCFITNNIVFILWI